MNQAVFFHSEIGFGLGNKRDHPILGPFAKNFQGEPIKIFPPCRQDFRPPAPGEQRKKNDPYLMLYNIL